MMKKQAPLLITSTALAAALSTGAQAGVITTTVLNDNESQIVNTGGGVISAANFGAASSGTATVDINGIIHAVASATNNGDGGDNIANLAINSTFDGHYRGGASTGAGYTGDMQNLMAGIAGIAHPNVLTLDISGLTIGTDYLFQAYWEANNFSQTANIVFEDLDSQSGIAGDGEKGVLISYTFTAGDDTLNVSFNRNGGSDNPWLQGYSLQVVPEPGSLALISLGGAMVLRRRRN